MSVKVIQGQPIKVKNGESFDWICCSCQLAHLVHVRQQGKDVVLRVFIDEYMTEKMRGKK